MSKLDIFLWLTAKYLCEVSRSSNRRSSVKKVFLKISQNSQEITCEFYEITKNAFSTEHIHKTASEFLPKDIDKFKECQTNESTKKNHLRRKKGKHGTEGNKLKCQFM